MNQSFRTITVESSAGVDWLTLARPEAFNAVNLEMAAELAAYFRSLHASSARVVVLAGHGKHFCAGFDLSEVAPMTVSVDKAMQVQRAMAAIVLQMRRCPQPIIALMHGAAAGAGFAIALAADVRYAAHGARMNVAMARIGLTGCDMGISYILPRTIGASNAAELMMTGRFVDAEHALRVGLVSRVVDQEELAGCGAALAGEMTAMSRLGLELTKQGINASLEAGSLEAVLALEDRGQVVCIGRYMKEGVAAFLEKRAPDYGS